MRTHLMNYHIDYDNDEERRKTHPILLPNISAGTKGK